MKKILTALVLIGIILVGCSSVGVNKNISKNTPSSVKPAISIVEELESDFKSIDPSLIISEQKFKIWWNDNEGYNIFVTSTDSFVVATSAPVISGGPDAVVGKYFYKEVALARMSFVEQGFMINASTTSTSSPDSNSDIWAYQRSNDLCTIQVNSDYQSYDSSGIMAYTLWLACGDTLAQAQAEQRPFIDALNYKGKGVVIINKHDGLFYSVNTWNAPGGESAILKKEASGYRVLFQGQDMPSCDIVNKEKIPDSVLINIGGKNCL